MKENKTDLRVVKTKKILYTTLVSLMQEYTFEEIKVSDICTRALINRSTFYAHYTDKYDLLSSCINDIKDSLTKELEKNKNISNSKEYYIEMIRLFLDYVDENKEIFVAIMNNNQNSIMVDMAYDVINKDIVKKLSKDEESTFIPSDIITKFYLGAVLNVGLEWLKNNQNATKEELISYLDYLIPADINKKSN